MSLVEITDNGDIEKDDLFLDELSKVFNSFETSTQFTSARNRIETGYQNARRTLKKRIKNDVWLTFEKSMKVVLQNTLSTIFQPPPPIYSNSLPNYTKQYESDFEFTTWRSVHHIKSNTLKNTKYYFPHTYFHLKIFSEFMLTYVYVLTLEKRKGGIPLIVRTYIQIKCQVLKTCCW